MTELCEVVITAPDPDWLYSFARALARTAWPPVRTTSPRCGRSTDGRVRCTSAAEGRVSLHTRRERVAQIVARAKREHPYEVPGVSARPIIDGDPDYLNWIDEQTATGIDRKHQQGT